MRTRTAAIARPLRAVASLSVALAALCASGYCAAQRLSGVPPSCPVASPTASQVVPSLLNGLLPDELNKAWQSKAPTTIDPYPQFDSSNQPVDKVIDGIPIPGICSADADAYCVLKGYALGCYSGHANVTLNSLTGLKDLQFTNALFTHYNLVDVAAHSDRGPDAGKFTDGVYAPDGHPSTDPEYAIVLPHSPGDPRAGIVVDLGASHSICGNGYNCLSGPELQADNDDYYELDYSSDGTNWTVYGQFPKCCSSGLQTRGVATITAGVHNPSFTARYVRVFPVSGGPTFAVAELQLWDTGSKLISVGKRAVGPQPYQLTSGAPPPDGHSSTDTQYAVVLRHETGPAPALVVDLGETKSICGNGFDCLSGPKIQADNDDFYQLDYSTDGVNWTGYGEFPSCCDSGLHTRGISTITAGVNNPSFKARYLRVYANSGGPTYAVSQLELWDTGSKPIWVGAATYGPEPVVTNGELPPNGTDYSDTRFATTLSPCRTDATSTCPTSTAQTASQVVDLGAAFTIDHLVIQADQAHTYQIDYSADAASWQPLWAVPTVSGSHLQTRTSAKFSPQPSARYLRVYGTTGAVDSYAVSALQVFTGQANNPCAYASGANSGENLACAYDGSFGFGIHSPFPVAFNLKQAQIVLVCQGVGPTGYIYGSYVQESATNRTCTDTLNVGPGTPEADFCAGSCASGQPSALLSYVHLNGEDLGNATNPTPSTQLQFFSTTPSSIACSGDFSSEPDIPTLADQVVASVATDATQGLFDGLLDYRTKPDSLIPFPPPHPPTSPPTFSACSALGSEPPPPGPYPDNIAHVNGRATQAGTGAANAVLHIDGQFSAPPMLELGQATVTVGGLLHEFRGAGELVQADAATSFLPVTLQAAPGSTPGNGLYATPPGVKPSMRVQISPAKGPGAQSGLMQFSIDVSRAAIAKPSRCVSGSAVANLGTSLFVLQAGATEPVWAHAIVQWQCDKGQLITSIGP